MPTLHDLIFPHDDPGFFGRINAIVDFAEDPCDATWLVYIQTALPALAIMSLMLLETGIDDVIRSYARPRNALGRGHKRSKTKKRKKIIGIPEPSDLFAEWIPAAEEVKARPVTDGVKFLWMIDGVTQRLLWYWLLIDLLTTGVFVWTSLINESRFCQAELSRGVRARAPGPNVVFGAQGWIFADFFEPDYEENGAGININVVTVPNGRWRLVWCGTVTNDRLEPIKFRARWRDSIGKVLGGDGTVEIALAPLESRQFFCVSYSNPFSNVAAEISVEQGRATVTDQLIYVQRL